ncbi:PREDICTED: serine/arginine-rich splicing factor 11-like isoform X1 [Myotis brandtii]|uniref:serine/arginine-rich splicing factor 11-like isoform X1 n=1 Tax=Myotis brandtii TaxID=109478 RepID=UPI000703EE7B|nr:PREDICTED: serine/arginine-rich splicing factor 11-like isoform X1 [Myotis brandtii]
MDRSRSHSRSRSRSRSGSRSRSRSPQGGESGSNLEGLGLEHKRSPSTSPEKEPSRQERSQSREKELRRSRSGSPHGRRSRSPRRHRSTSPSPSRLKERRDEEKKERKSKEGQITEEDLEGKTEEEIEMMKVMGFSAFDSTKAGHELQRWIQQTFGFHCVRIEMLKNGCWFLHLDQKSGFCFVFLYFICIKTGSQSFFVKKYHLGQSSTPFFFHFFVFIPVEAVYVFFLGA